MFKVEALARPEYDSRINGTFDVTGSVPRTPSGTRRAAADAPPVIATMTLEASGTLTDSEFLGGRLPELRFDAHLDQDTLTGRADGRFEGFNPARLTGRKELDGTVTGTVNANYAIRNISAPITVDAVTADGTLALTQSTVGGLKIDSAAVEGKYAAQAGDIVKLNVAGPDVRVEASGRLALDRTSASNVKYHVDAINLTELARLAGQTGVGGTAILDGTISGNAASLQATGTLDGSNLVVRGQQGARPQQPVHGHGAGPGVRESARAGDHRGHVRGGRRHAAQLGHRDDHLRSAAPGFHDAHQGKDPRAGRHRPAPAAPRSPGGPPAAVRGPHAGGRVARGPRHRGDHQVRPRPRRAREREAGQRGSGARRERHARARRRRDIGRHRRARAQRGHPAAGDAAAAEPRVHGQADRGREDHRFHRGPRDRGAHRGRQGRVQVLPLRLARRERGLPRHADRDRRHAAAVADRVDYGERERADDRVQGERGRRTCRPGRGRADRPADQVHADRPGPRAGPDRRPHQRHRHARNRRARDRLGAGPAPQGLHRHQGWRLRRTGPRGHLYRADDPDRAGAGPRADSAVPAAGSSRREAHRSQGNSRRTSVSSARSTSRSTRTISSSWTTTSATSRRSWR